MIIEGNSRGINNVLTWDAVRAMIGRDVNLPDGLLIQGINIECNAGDIAYVVINFYGNTNPIDGAMVVSWNSNSGDIATTSMRFPLRYLKAVATRTEDEDADFNETKKDKSMMKLIKK